MNNTSLGIFSLAASAMTAQSQRMNLTASNLANADTVAGPDDTPYRARHPVFELLPQGGGELGGVRVSRVVEDTAPLRMAYQPHHPLADPQGMVRMSNVNPVDEMVNMISASRSYQANVEVLNTAKTLALKTLTLGQ